MSDLTEWREELAGMLGEHAWDTSDEQKIDGEWVWGLCCDCGEFVPGEETNTHLADAVLASPAMARLLGEVRAEALREAAEELDALPSYRFEGGEDHYGEDRIHAYGRDDEAERIAGWLRDRATAAHPTDDHAGEAK